MATDSPHDPPFRADHVGSLLRPPELLKARGDRASRQNLRRGVARRRRRIDQQRDRVPGKCRASVDHRRRIPPRVFYSDFYFRGLGGGTVAYDPSSIDEVYFIDREGHKLPLLVPRVESRMRCTLRSTWTTSNFSGLPRRVRRR